MVDCGGVGNDIASKAVLYSVAGARDGAAPDVPASNFFDTRNFRDLGQSNLV